MKQFTDLYIGELSEFRVINKAQRRKMALRLKKLTKSSAFKKKVQKSKLRVANPAKQRVKAAKMAKQKVIDKYYPKYKEMGRAAKAKIDQVITVKHGAKISKIAKRLLPKVKVQARQDVKRARELAVSDPDA